MKDLLYKEFRLVIIPIFYLTALFSALLLIPDWVYFVAMLYLFFIVVPNIFSNAKAMNDTGFSMMLPVRKRDIVKARVLSIAVLEIIQIVSAVLFAILNIALYAKGNFLIDANIAFIGCVLVMYGLFNVIFFPLFYKTAFKIGWPTAIAVTVSVLFAAAVETLVLTVPAANNLLDGISSEALVRQLPVIASGILLFVLLTTLAYRISAKNFEKVDL